MTISTEELWTLVQLIRERLGYAESTVLTQGDVGNALGRDIVLIPDTTKWIVGQVVDIDPSLVVSAESFVVLEGDASRALSLILACRNLDAYTRRVALLSRDCGFTDEEIEAREMNVTAHLLTDLGH